MQVGTSLTEASTRQLNSIALDTLSLLGCPIFIYSFLTERICWANDAALDFLKIADIYAAGGNENISRELAARLSDYPAIGQAGGDRIARWSFCIDGAETFAQCRSTSVAIEGHDKAILVEVQSQAKRPETELRALEALRHTSLKISLFNEAGAILFRNPAAAEIYAPIDARAPQGIDQFLEVFSDPRAGQRLIEMARQERVARAHVTTTLPGNPVHAVQLSIVKDPVTGGLAYLLAQQDVSQLFEASRQLEESEQALESILRLDVTPAIILSKADGTVLLSNLAFQQMILRHGGRPAIKATDFLTLADFNRLRAGAMSLETKLITEESGFWASIAGVHISFAAQDALVLLLTDVNGLYEAAAALEQELTNERATNSRQQDFLAMTSHEFRTPLAVIDSAAQRLARVARSTDVQIHAIARKIRNNVGNLIAILDRTLETSRANAIDFHPELASLSEPLAAAVEEARERYPQAQIDARIGALPPMQLDRTLIVHLFANLLANAVKYSGARPWVDVSAWCEGNVVNAVVADNGIGIGEQDREGLFKPFVRGSNCAGVSGTGLGLSIVQIIAQLHGGQVELLPNSGTGSSFRLTIPVSRNPG